MARAIWLPGGGGADLDVVTAAAGDVVKGKVIVDAEGNPLTGTLELTGNAVAGDIIKGRTAYTTNPNSKVTGTLALTGTAVAANLRKGKTMYTTDPKTKITGTMAEQAAQTITPGTANKTIAANRFLTGVQTISGDKNLIGANIIRGKTIFGVAGEAVYAGDIEGYFLEPPKEYESLTGGWTLNESTSLACEKGSTYYRVYTKDGYFEEMAYLAKTNSKVDLSKYRKIYFDYDVTINNIREDTQYGNPNTLRLQLAADDRGAVVNGGAEYGLSMIEITNLKPNTVRNVKGTITLDVSTQSSLAYISMAFRNTSLSSGFKPSFSLDVKLVAVRYDKIQ